LQEKTQSTVYIPQFDIIRFFAAFMIVIYHSYIGWKGWFGVPGIISTGDYRTLSAAGIRVDQFVRNLPFGVDIFFFISGFLLTYLLVMEKERFGKVNVPKFYIRRGLRIWPLYFFLIAVTPFLINWLGDKQPTYWPTIALINNFETIWTQQWVYPFSHFWSICIEEHFYLFWPLIIAFIPNRKLPAAIILLICFSWMYKIHTYLFLDSNWYQLYLHTFSRMDVILLGGLLAVFYLRKPFEFSLHWSIILAISLILVILFAFDDLSNFENMFNGVTRKFVYVTLSGLIMMDMLFNPKRKNYLCKFKPLLYLGKVSYGIYMYGNILVWVVMRKVILDYNINNLYLYFTLIFVSSLLIPVISYEILEKPFLKLKQKFALVKTRM
jgi:peptidoglycan/LPS O-acetylase OafA/YrhL